MRGTEILTLLRAKPGRYVLQDMGEYTMKEEDGTDVVVHGHPVRLWAMYIEALEDAGKLVPDDASKLIFRLKVG